MRFLKNSTKLNIKQSFSLGLLDILFPPFCYVCGKRLDAQDKVICGSCWSKIQPTNLGNWKNCVTIHEYLDCVLTGWFMDDIFQRIIHSLKYHEKRIIGEELGQRLAEMFREELYQMALDVVIPVPLYPAKFRERGFNQSDLVGKIFANHVGIPYKPKLLRRKKNTQSQTALSVDERKENVEDAFLAKDLSHYQRFLVIDDVLTTGATLSSCAKALRHRGAEFIAVITAGTPTIDMRKPENKGG